MSNLAGCPSRLDVRVGWMSKSAGCPSRLDVRVGWMSSRLDVQLVGCPVGWMSFGWMSESAGCPSRLDVRRLDVQSAGSPVGWMSSRLDVQSAGCPSAGCLSAGCESAGCPQVERTHLSLRFRFVFYDWIFKQKFSTRLVQKWRRQMRKREFLLKTMFMRERAP